MMKSIIHCFFLTLVILCTACIDDGHPGPTRQYRFYRSLEIDGRQRTYLLNLPPDYYSGLENFALIVAMHGTGGDAYQFESDYKFTQMANDEQFIVVYPEGVRSSGPLGIRTWNAGYCCDYAADNNIADVEFINQLLDELLENYNIDPERIYATGMSNGGMMAYRLACEMPERIAAIATVSCTMVTGQDISPTQPVPVLHLHSEQDTKIPPLGGVGLADYYFAPLDSVFNVWAEMNGCTSGPEIIWDDDEYKLTRWTSCSNDAVIEYYLTKDGGHAWPGSRKVRARADEPSHVIDANDLIREFFQEHTLSQ